MENIVGMQGLSSKEQLIVAIQLHCWAYGQMDLLLRNNKQLQTGSAFFWSDADEKFLEAVS